MTGRKEVKDKVPREKSTGNFETTTKMTKKYQTKGKDTMKQRHVWLREGAIQTQ